MEFIHMDFEIRGSFLADRRLNAAQPNRLNCLSMIDY